MLYGHKVVKHVVVVHVGGFEVKHEHGLNVGLEPGLFCLEDLNGLAAVHPEHDHVRAVEGDTRLVHGHGCCVCSQPPGTCRRTHRR